MGKVQSIFAKSAIDEIKTFDSLVNVLHGDITKLATTIEELNKTYAKSKTSQEKIIKAQKDQATNQKKLNTVTTEAQKVSRQLIQVKEKLTIVEGAQSKGLIKRRQELQKTTQELKLLAIVENKEAGTLDKLKAKVKLNSIERGKLNLKTREGRKRLRELNAETNKANKVIAKNSDALTRQKIGIGRYAQGIKSAVLQLAGLTGGLYLFATAIRNTIKLLVNFEKEFANVLTLLDEADRTKWGGLLKAGAVDLVREFGFSIEDLNKALFDTISAGVPAGSAIDFLRETAILAKGGVTDLSTAVDGVTSIMNSYGIAASETNKITAAFFSAQKFGKTTVAELSQNIGQVAPIAKLAGVSFQELLSTFAELTKQGVKTTDSVTAIKAIIQAVIKPAEGAKEKFKELGIETGLTAVKEQGLFTIIEKVTRAASADSDVLTELIPNVRALTGAGALGAEALEDYHKILEVVNSDYGEGSSLSQAYGTQTATLTEKINSLSGSWKAFILSLNTSNFGSAIKNGIEVITYNLDLLSGAQKLYGKQVEETTELTEEELQKQVDSYTKANNAIISEIEAEGKRLKEFYGDDFTSFDDYIQEKEGAKLKYLFAESARLETEISGYQELIDVYEVDRQAATEAANKKTDELLSTQTTGNALLLAATEKLLVDEINLKKKYKSFSDEDIESDITATAQTEADEMIALSVAQADAAIRERERSVNAEIMLMEAKGATEAQITEFLSEQYQKDADNTIEVLKNKLELIREIEGENSVEFIEAEQEILDLELEMEQQRRDASTQTMNERIAHAQQFFGAIQGIMSQITSIMSQAYDNQMIDFQNQKAHELKLAGDNEEKKAKINEKYAKKEKDLKTKKAEADKKAAIISATISAALAVLQALASTGPPANIILAALVGVLGAIEIGVIASQPIPKFAKGTESSPEGLAIIGEKGREIFQTPKGETGIATSATLANLERGTRIYSNPETEMILKQAGGNVGYDSGEIKRTLERNNEKLIKTIENKKEITIYARKNRITERTGNYFKTYINSKITD